MKAADKTQLRSRTTHRFVILTGLSGSGKTHAIRALEDLGYFCVDNLPSQLIPTFADLASRGDAGLERVAIVVDVREGGFLKQFPKVYRKLKSTPGVEPRLIFLEAKPIVFAIRIPALQPDHQFDALRCPRRRHAEQIADVDHPEATHFHVMPRQLGACSDHRRLAAPAYFDRVVGDQAMAADDQIERALALADAAVSDDQDAQPENVHQHAVHHLANGERIVEERGDLGDRNRRCNSRAQHWHSVRVGCREQIGRSPATAGDQHARNLVREHRAEHGHAGVVIEALEVTHLAFAEHEDPRRPKILMEASKREPGLLDMRAGDGSIEAAASAQEFERKSDGVRAALQKPLHRQRRCRGVLLLNAHGVRQITVPAR